MNEGNCCRQGVTSSAALVYSWKVNVKVKRGNSVFSLELDDVRI